MRIHPEGYPAIVKFFFFGFLIDTAVIALSKNDVTVILIMSAITLIVGVLIFNFFDIPRGNGCPTRRKCFRLPTAK